MSDVVCTICGKSPKEQPFPHTSDNNWNYNAQAHAGCIKNKRAKEVQQAATDGYNTAIAGGKYPTFPQETKEKQRGGRQEAKSDPQEDGIDPDLQAQ